MNFWEWASTMSIEQVLGIVLSFAKALAWPAVVVGIAIMFRKELTALLQRLESFDGLGIQSKFRQAVDETIEGSEAAQEDATVLAAANANGLKFPNVGGEDATAEGDNVAVTPDDVATGDGAKRKGAAQNSPESAVWSSFRRGMRHAQGDPQRLLAIAWRRLEEETERTTHSLNLGAKSTMRLGDPRDPVALFRYLGQQGLVSEETVRGVRRAKKLLGALRHGYKGETYSDDVAGVAGAIDGFRRSLTTIRMSFAGRQAVEAVLREHGNDKLPGA